MNEVEKLYDNAGIKPRYRCTYRDVWCPIEDVGKYNPKCPRQSVIEICDVRTKDKRLPLFTAEKQLELIKWSARREPKVEIGYSPVHGYCVENPTDTCYYFGEQFDNALASLINILWQDLTAEEQRQIKEILRR